MLTKVLAPLALLGGATAGAISLAQPPGGEGQEKRNQPFDRKAPGFQPGEKKGGGPFGPGGQPPGPGSGPRGPMGGGSGSTDPDVDAWLRVLIEKMNDPHDTIRDSARAGIVAIGPAAIPKLRQLADGHDGAKAVAARRLIGMIEQHHRGPGNGFGPGPGAPGGLGPRGPGNEAAPGGPGPRPGGPGVGPAGPGPRPNAPSGPGGVRPRDPGNDNPQPFPGGNTPRPRKDDE